MIYWILHLLPIYKRTIWINFSFKLKARAVNAGSRLQKKFLNKIQKLGPRCRTVHFCGRYAWDLEVNSMHPSFELDLSDILSGRGKDPIPANLTIQNRGVIFKFSCSLPLCKAIQASWNWDSVSFFAILTQNLVPQFWGIWRYFWWSLTVFFVLFLHYFLPYFWLYFFLFICYIWFKFWRYFLC